MFYLQIITNLEYRLEKVQWIIKHHEKNSYVEINRQTDNIKK